MLPSEPKKILVATVITWIICYLPVPFADVVLGLADDWTQFGIPTLGWFIPYTVMVAVVGLIYGGPVYWFLRRRGLSKYAHFGITGAIPGLLLALHWPDMALFLAAFGAFVALVFRFTIVRVGSNNSLQARRP